MDFEYSARTKELQKKLLAFFDEHVYPNEGAYYAHVHGDRRWEPVPVIEELKPKAKAARAGSAGGRGSTGPPPSPWASVPR